MRIVRVDTVGYIALLSVILGSSVAFIGMNVMPMGGWLGVIPVMFILWFGLRRPLRRWRLAREDLPQAWRQWLSRHIGYYRGLDDDAKARFERDVRFLMDELTFESVEGAHVTDELRLCVAAGGALLLHGRPQWELSTKHTFLFYPGAFDEHYYEGEEADYDGMAHHQGPVILSVPAVKESWLNTGNGSNVVLHELAHLLDFDNAFADGMPSLAKASSEKAWYRLMRHEMQRIRAGKSLLRRYGATNAAEFFAVAVENFFDRPTALAHRHSELFEALVAFFGFDPRSERSRAGCA